MNSSLESSHQHKLTQARYDRLSKVYNLISGKWEDRHRLLGIRKLALKPGLKVLEIGTGTGKALPTLANGVSPTGNVTGFDISLGMLSVAHAYIQDTSNAEIIHLLAGDACQMPFQDDWFDVLFFSFTLELFSDEEIPVVLSECLRITNPGGWICVVSLSKSSKDTIMLHLYEWLQKIFPQWIDCRSILVESIIRNAGFLISTIQHCSLIGLPVEIVCAQKPSLTVG